jgi:gliding motility-associated-like protein
MKKAFTKLGLVLCAVLYAPLLFGQMVGTNVFIKGKYVEIGIAPIGAFGSSTGVPAGGGYHPRPGGGGTTLGFVSDPAMDGWTTGSPGYVGDYFLPGDPQEGWDVQVNGIWNQAWRGAGGTGTLFTSSSGTPTLTGTNILIDTIGTKIYSVWEGSMETDLFIRQTTTLDTNRVFFVCDVVLKNTGTTTLTNIYYNRTLDPDNESAMPGGGGPLTDNAIVFQPGTENNKALVTATGTSFPDLSYLGLGTIDCRAKAYILPNGLNPDRFNVTLDGIYNEEAEQGWEMAPYIYGVGETTSGDQGVGVVFNIGDLAPGDSTVLSYAYILREADLDSAFAALEPAWTVEGAGLSTGDTVQYCMGATIDIAITGGGGYNWDDWSPATGLASTSGSTNTITVGTEPITYRVIGTTILCPQNDTLFITVDPILAPPPGVDSGGNICANATPVSLFDYIGGDPPTTGYWTGPGTTASGIFDPTIAGIGVHDIVYTVSVDGCLGFNTVTMNVYNDVDIDFSWDLIKGCAGDTVAFINQAEEGTYRWNFGDASAPDTNTNPSHFYTAQGEYAVWLVVQNNKGCIDSAQKVVNTQHPLIANFTMDFDSICQNGIINFMDNSTGSIQRWDWNFGDGTTSTIQSPSHHYTLAGYHTVRLVVTDDVPCTDTFYQNVYIDSLPSLEILTDKPEVCNGERINMSLEYLYTANGFTWDFGDGTMLADGSSSTFHSYDAPGEYYIEVRSHHPNCRDAIAYDTIKVKPYPVVNLGPDTTLCLNGAPLFISSEGAVPVGTQWQWSTGDTTAVLKVVHPGTYVAQAILDGCTGSDEITVTKDCYTDIPNSFTPDGDGVNDYFLPRQLLSKGVIGFNMTIFDRWGQKVFETNSIEGRGWDGKMNEKDMPVGVYVYMINVVYKNNTSEKYTGNVTLLR